MFWKKLKDIFSIDSKYAVTDLTEEKRKIAEEALCKINRELVYYYEYRVLSAKECVFNIECIMMSYAGKYNEIMCK